VLACHVDQSGVQSLFLVPSADTFMLSSPVCQVRHVMISGFIDDELVYLICIVVRLVLSLP
jgi:hypothetical protein